MGLQVCIGCLTSNIKMHSIMNTHLQEVYEKLTSNKLIHEERQSVCYICCSQLQRSYRFLETSKLADKKLKQVLQHGNEITHEIIALLNNRTPQSLGVAKVHSISLSGYSDDNLEMGKFVDENIIVKSEPLDIEAEIEQVEFNEETVKNEFETNEERINQIQSVFIQVKFDTAQESDDNIVKTEQDKKIKDERIDEQITQESDDDIVKTEQDEQIQENSQKLNSASKNNSSIDIYCYCDYCDKKCLIKSELEKHMKMHDPRRNHVCRLCGFRFRQLKVLIQHEYYSHGIQDNNVMSADKPFSCIVCNKTFLFEDKLKVHLKNHTVDKLYHCDVCDKNLMSKKSLTRHMRIHNSQRAYTCKICNRTCDSISNMRNHVRIHTGEKPFACNLCDKTYHSKSTLKTHMTSHSQDNQANAQKFACEFCPKVFPNKTKLVIHVRSHTGDKPYACTECDKSFALAHSLKTHKRTHTGEKPFACDACDKTFNQSCQLRLHKRVHTGEKPYPCKLCGKAFPEMGKLKIHMVSHTGEKLTCDKCDSTFTTQSSKKRHMLRIHGGKSFSCQQCDKSFSVLPSLESHVRIIHAGEKPFACTKCNKSYSEKKGLNKHVMKVHVDISDDEKDEKPLIEIASKLG